MNNRILKGMLIVAVGLGVLAYAGIKLGHINPNTGRFVTPIYEETLARIRTSTPTRTETSTPTFTPISESTDFYAVTAVEVDCFDWSYRKLTVIEPLESVWVLGSNKQATWYIVRWPKFTTQCWVEAALLKPGNFSQEELREISTDFPPPATATPTLIPIGPTLSPTLTRTYITYTPTRTRHPSQGDSTPIDPKTSAPTPTNTLKSATSTPTHTAKPPTDTPTPTATSTPKPPTYTPTPTSTPADPECRNAGDNDESK